MKEKIIEFLSENEKLEKNIVCDLVESFSMQKNEYLKGRYEESLLKAGVFVENLFILLNYILSKKKLDEIKQTQFDQISSELAKAKNDDIPESIRILVPRIAKSMIYDVRSKTGAIHKKSIVPDKIDVKLTISAADWIMAELLRTYHKRDTMLVQGLIDEVIEDFLPVTEKIGDDFYINRKVSCEEEVLIQLHENQDGLTRPELGKLISNFSSSNVTKVVKKLIMEKRIFRINVSSKYIISDTGKIWILDRISKLGFLN